MERWKEIKRKLKENERKLKGNQRKFKGNYKEIKEIKGKLPGNWKANWR